MTLTKGLVITQNEGVMDPFSLVVMETLDVVNLKAHWFGSGSPKLRFDFLTRWLDVDIRRRA